MALEKIQVAIENFEYSTELNDMAFDSDQAQDKAVLKAIQTLKKEIDIALKSSTMTNTKANISDVIKSKKIKKVKRKSKKIKKWFFF